MTSIKMHQIFYQAEDLRQFSCPKCFSSLEVGSYYQNCSKCDLRIWDKKYIDFRVIDAFSGKGFYISYGEDYRLSFSKNGPPSIISHHKHLNEVFIYMEKMELL